MAAARIQHWALTLAPYNYSIEYKPELEHANSDALSQLPLQVIPPTTAVHLGLQKLCLQWNFLIRHQ